MASITFEPNRQQLNEALAYFDFVGGNSRDAVRIATNKTLPQARTKIARRIYDRVNLKSSYIKGQIKQDKATRRDLRARLFADWEGVLLTRYSTDPNVKSVLSKSDKGLATWFKPPPTPPRGIRVKVKRGGATETMGRNWFYMVLRDSRALAIATRRTTLGPRGGKYRVGLAPSASQEFDDARDAALPEVSEDYTKNLLGAVNFLLRKQYPQ